MSTPLDLLRPDILIDGDHAEVRFTKDYATTPADLWDAVTTPERLARWFAPVAGDLQPGGEFTITFDDGDVPRARVLECVAPQRFSFEWPLESGPTVVAVEVAAGEGGGSRLHLTHARLPLASTAGYTAGWDSYLRYLAETLAGRDPQGWWDSFAEARARYERQIEDAQRT